MDDQHSAAAGHNRSPGISWDELMRQDSRQAPEFLTQDSYRYLGSDPLSIECYISEDYAAREREMMWPHVWQIAAREEDLQEPGDYIVYENAGRSYLVTRQEDGSVKALHNVCLHRGRKLRTEEGCADSFICPFHGFAWNKDGTLATIPCRWDFSNVDESELNLPEAEVGRWAGYIFLREQPGGLTLEEYLAPLPEHYKLWRHEECTTAVRVIKELRSNWKVAVEAFMESWHSVATHPQLLPITGDSNAAYGVLTDIVNTHFTPFAIMSPHIDPEGRGEQWIYENYLKFEAREPDPDGTPGGYPAKLPEGVTARQMLAQLRRENFTKMFGHDHSEASDTEMLDAIVYNVFPNFAPWGGFMPNIVYCFKPGATVDTCFMETRLLVRVPPGQPIPPAAPAIRLGLDDPFAGVTEMGVLAPVLEQDLSNLAYTQEGLHCSKNGKIILGDYQEVRIRQFHLTLEKFLAGERPGA